MQCISIIRAVIDTAHGMRGSVYVMVGRPSVCPSVCPIVRVLQSACRDMIKKVSC